MLQSDADLFEVGGEQCQGGEGRRADGEALPRGGCGVAQRIERVGAAAHLGPQPAHFGVAARIVGDRAVGVGRERDAQRREHPDGGDAYAVKPHGDSVRRHHGVHVEADGAEVGQDDRRPDGDYGHGRGDHADAHAGDDDRCRPRLGAFGDPAGGLIGVGGVVFGRLSDDDAGDKARDHRAGVTQPVVDPQQVEDAERRGGDERRAGIDPEPERSEQLFHGGAFARAHQEDAEDREEDAHGGDQHGGHHRAGLHPEVAPDGECRSSEGRRRQDRSAVALVEVGAHAGHVANVVAHVIGDRGWVARIVLRDARLDLADDVGPHVGGFGIDTAAYAGEEGLRRSPHAEGEHRGGHHHQLLGPVGIDEAVEDEIPYRNIQQPESHDDQSHDRPAAESHPQPAVERRAGRLCRACRGVGGRLHAEKARQSGEKTAGEEGERHPRILHARTVGQPCEQQGQHQKDDPHDFVLLSQIGHGPLPDVAGDGPHAFGAFVLTFHVAVEAGGGQECRDGCDGDEPEDNRNIHGRVF